jgi:hypothetical protein
VIALNGNWLGATDQELNQQRFAFINEIQAMLDQ